MAQLGDRVARDARLLISCGYDVNHASGFDERLGTAELPHCDSDEAIEYSDQRSRIETENMALRYLTAKLAQQVLFYATSGLPPEIHILCRSTRS